MAILPLPFTARLPRLPILSGWNVPLDEEERVSIKITKVESLKLTMVCAGEPCYPGSS